MPKKILVVDDGEALREMFRDMIGRLGYDVSVASNGEEALRMCEAAKFDFVLTDVDMPVMDGITFSKRLASKEGHCPIILLMSSAVYSIEEVGEHIAFIFNKPFSRQLLNETLQRLQEVADLPGR